MGREKKHIKHLFADKVKRYTLISLACKVPPHFHCCGSYVLYTNTPNTSKTVFMCRLNQMIINELRDVSWDWT